jgi:hypothetical protein
MKNTIDDADYIINWINFIVINQCVKNSSHSHSIVNEHFLAFNINDLIIGTCGNTMKNTMFRICCCSHLCGCKVLSRRYSRLDCSFQPKVFRASLQNFRSLDPQDQQFFQYVDVHPRLYVDVHLFGKNRIDLVTSTYSFPIESIKFSDS